MTATGLEAATLKLINKVSTIWPNWQNHWVVSWNSISAVHLTVCYYYIACAIESQSTLYIFLNLKEHHAPNRCNIWSLSDSNGTQTHNHLARKRTLNYLTKLSKWWAVFWILICNEVGIHNRLACRRILNHLAKIPKWLSCVLRSYLYGASNFMLMSYQVRISNWNNNLYLPEC